MIDVESLWLQLIEEGESDRLEAKEAQGGIGDSIMQSICAFANEPGLGGGYLLLGVRESDQDEAGFVPVGVNDIDTLLNTLQTNCRDQFTASIAIQAESGRIDGNMLVAIRVEEADDATKPIRFKGIPGGKNKNKRKTGAWRRGINGDYEFHESELEPLIRAKNGRSYDQTILPGAEWDDIDPDMIALYRQRRAHIRPGAEELQASDEEMLRALHLVEKTEQGWVPNLAGLLLLGKTLSLRRLLPVHRVDYIRVPGKEWVEDPDHRYDSIDMRAPLLRLIPRAEAAILDDLPKRFYLPEGQLQRQDIPLLPQRVVREMVVNALMHRDYHLHEPIQIIRYSNRIEISNPGFSLKPEDELGESRSRLRNPVLAQVLYELNFAETKGTGIRVMRRLLKEAGLSAPLFASRRGADTFRGTFLFYHFLSDGDLQWLEQFKALELTDGQKMALLFVREQGAIDNAAFRDINVINPLAASQQLAKLRQLELLSKEGKGPATYYLPGPAFPDIQPAPLSSESSDRLESETDKLVSDADRLESNADRLEFDADRLESDTDKLEQNREQLTAQLPESLIAALPGPGSKPRKQEMKLLILRLCQQRAFTAAQLCQLLGGRRRNHLTAGYLTPMVNEKLLEQTSPVRFHKHQAYRTSEKGLGLLNEVRP